MARGTAQELFRDNIGSIVDPGISTLFADNGFDMGVILDPSLSAHDLDAANAPERVITARAKAEAVENHDGIISGNRDGVRNGLAERVVDARDNKAARSARDDERANDTAFYLALMQNGEFDRYVAEQVYSSMSDDEIMTISTEVLEETGKSIEQHAKEVLGEENVERQPGESEADYYRRLWTELRVEMMERDPETGRYRLKEEYEDHVLGSRLLNHQEQARIDPILRETAELVAANGSVEQAMAELQDSNVVDQGLTSEIGAQSLTSNYNLQADPKGAEVLVELAEDRDTGREADLDTDEDATLSANVLGSFGANLG